MEVLKLLQHNQFVLVTGKAGTGKSTLLRQLYQHFLTNNKNMNIFKVAPTAIASNNIGGITLHSFVNMGLAQESKEILLQRLNRKSRQNLTNCHLLLIDEGSMIDPIFFEKLGFLMANCQNHPSKPFGVTRLVIFADFLQLAPITNSTKYNFIFQLPMWKIMNVKKLVLTNIFRQNHPQFINLLNNIRIGNLNESDIKIIKSRIKQPPKGVFYTRLTCLRKNSTQFNDAKLNGINSPLFTFKGIIKSICKPKADKKLVSKLCRYPDKLFPIEINLKLKVGALVMLRTNNYYPYCNGSIGKVTDINDNIITVLFSDSKYLQVSRFLFKHDQDPFISITCNQFPLSLAWAFTIHKSQGLTLSKALICGSTFAAGQFYVAMSRVRDINDIFIESDDIQIITDDEAKEYSRLLES